MSWTVWIGALAIGLVLGLLGSGGSILAVPMLVYLAGEPATLAIAESLAVVFTISSVGAASFMWRGQVAWTSVLVFGAPAMPGGTAVPSARAARSVPWKLPQRPPTAGSAQGRMRRMIESTISYMPAKETFRLPPV